MGTARVARRLAGGARARRRQLPQALPGLKSNARIMLQIHNSLTGRKEVFKPLEPGKVGMYVCGITVYDYCHLGHARMLIVFDVVRRHLRRVGLRRHVRPQHHRHRRQDHPARAGEQRADAGADRALHQGLPRRLRGARRAARDHEPRATEYVPQIVAMVQTLVDKGYAYAADNGDVYYAVAKFEPYGQLSGKRLADLRAGARVEVDEAKRDPLDFVLWKAAKPGEPAWDSPWGPGRPGWHIECSAMSVDILGTHFDIHGGGMDLKFPHHENEIAQTCAACDSQFVNVWMHNGFVRVDDEKMSKSLGNFFTVREVLELGARPGSGALLHRQQPVSRADQLHAGQPDAGRCRARTAVPRAARRDAVQRRRRDDRLQRTLRRRDGRRLQYADGDCGTAVARARDQYGQGGR